MTAQSLVRSTQVLLDHTGATGARWEAHLKRLQARRDALALDLAAANVAIAQHIQSKNAWVQYVNALDADAEKWA